MGYIKCSSVQGTPILVYLPYLPFLVNEHFIFIDIQTILPNIVNIELREFLYFSRQNPNPHSVISMRNRLRMSDENGTHRHLQQYSEVEFNF